MIINNTNHIAIAVIISEEIGVKQQRMEQKCLSVPTELSYNKENIKKMHLCLYVYHIKIKTKWGWGPLFIFFLTRIEVIFKYIFLLFPLYLFSRKEM